MSTANLFAIHELRSSNPVAAASQSKLLNAVAKGCTSEEAGILSEIAPYICWSSDGCLEMEIDEAGTSFRRDLSSALLACLNRLGKAVGGWDDGGMAYWRTDDGSEFFRQDFIVESGQFVDDGRQLEGACGDTFDNISRFTPAQVDAFVRENDLDVDFGAYVGNKKAKNWKALAVIEFLQNAAE